MENLGSARYLLREGDWMERSSLDVVKTMDSVDGLALGELMKGCHQLIPPQPKYSEIWNPENLSSFMGLLGENRNFSLKVFTSNLVTLIALDEGGGGDSYQFPIHQIYAERSKVFLGSAEKDPAVWATKIFRDSE
ncbi:hypothetical protein OUZ56_012795 [Daphnia magna]|uniref:Uncharacterized protein n=1 Tax=Daphnia magna TaxID=35525 RepID=A0ABQ9Z430_9CRUS|nr:hypothetical protein OUZ56_012795 [Daphnia magna]